MGIQASLTGHLVFSTLHTNDAPGAITRMIDMGVPAYLVVEQRHRDHWHSVWCGSFARNASSRTHPRTRFWRRPESRPRWPPTAISCAAKGAETARNRATAAVWASSS